MSHKRPSAALSLISIFHFLHLFLSLALATFSLVFFSSVPVTLFIDNVPYGLALGHLPLSTLFLALTLLSSLVITELFGKLTAFFVVWGSALALTLMICLIKVIPFLPFMEGNASLATPTFKGALLLLAEYALLSLGFTLALLSFGFLRKLTRNHFHILRYLFASLVGALTLALVAPFLDYGMAFQNGTFLVEFLTPAIQIIALMILLWPFGNILNWIFGLILGSEHLESISSQFVRHNLFRPEEGDFFGSREAKQEKRI